MNETRRGFLKALGISAAAVPFAGAALKGAEATSIAPTISAAPTAVAEKYKCRTCRDEKRFYEIVSDEFIDCPKCNAGLSYSAHGR